VRVLGLLFAAAFAFALYFFATTASLRNEYQPGIEQLRFRFDPRVLVVAATLFLASLGAVWRSGRPTLAALGQRLILWMLGVCLAGEAAIHLSLVLDIRCGGWMPPERGLRETVHHSLTCAQVSGLSYVAAYHVVLLLPALWVLASRFAEPRGSASESVPVWTRPAFGVLASALLVAGGPLTPFLVVDWVDSLRLPISPLFLVPVASLALGLAFQVVLFPCAHWCDRRRAPMWRGAAVACIAAWLAALAFVAIAIWREGSMPWAHGSVTAAIFATILAPPFALAFMAQLAALRLTAPFWRLAPPSQ